MTIDPDEVEQVRAYLRMKQEAYDRLAAGTVDADVLDNVESCIGPIKKIVPRYPGEFGNDG